MPRCARNSLETNLIHVITQGINKSYIFEHSEDIKKYTEIMYTAKEEYCIEILATLKNFLKNHFHFLKLLCIIYGVKRSVSRNEFTKQINSI